MTMLAEMGYKYLELGGTYGEKPAQLKAFMDEIGLIPLAGGTSIAGLLGEGLQLNIDACLEMDKKYHGRFELVPIKDSYDSPDRESFAPVGDGVIDFTELLSYRDVGGFKYLIVENDQPGKNQEAVARTSIQHLQSLKF